MAESESSIQYAEIEVSCGCGNSFKTRSTLGKNLKIEVCSKCHPFYTNQQRVIVSNSSMLQFQKRYGVNLGNSQPNAQNTASQEEKQ